MLKIKVVFGKMWAVGVAVALAGVSSTSVADDRASKRVTFSKDVAPILFANCVSCHRPGDIAPMSLLTYEQARPWAKSIRTKVAAREMPPWSADPKVGHFRNDMSLSDAEIDTILQWIDQGTPRGNPSDMPMTPDLPPTGEWQLGTPDYIITLPEVTVPAEGPDIFPNVIVPIDIPEDRWIQAIETLPDNLKVNHHTTLFMGAGFGGRDTGFFDFLSVWTPGTPPAVFPEGMGKLIPKGAIISVSRHFHVAGTEETDRSRIGFYFGDGPLKKQIRTVLPGTLNFSIPPQASDYVMTAKYLIHEDSRAISLYPHMHLRGRSQTIVAHYPDGTRETLLNVPKWDFGWQWMFYPTEPILLPRGTLIEVEAHYDNTLENPWLGRYGGDPDRAVTWGQQSTDEMMFGMIEVIAEEGTHLSPITEEARIGALLERYSAEDLYRIDLTRKGTTTASVLHLPRQGEGLWFLFGGLTQWSTMRVTELDWEAEDFSFETVLNLPVGLGLAMGGAAASGMSGDLTVRGSLSVDGSIRGSFIRAAEPEAELSIEPFEGVRVAIGR